MIAVCQICQSRKVAAVSSVPRLFEQEIPPSKGAKIPKLLAGQSLAILYALKLEASSG
jgi:hypothetical protein